MILDNDYRLNSGVSNSMIKKFIKDGPKLYWDEFIDPMRLEPAEWHTESTDIGDLVDCKVTQPGKFNQFYYIIGDVRGSEDFKAVVKAARDLVIRDLVYDPMDCSISMEEALKRPEVKDITLANKDFLIKAALEHINLKTGEVGYRANYKNDTLVKYIIDNGSSYYEALGTAGTRRVIDMNLDNTANRVKEDFDKDDIIGSMLAEKDSEHVIIHKQWVLTGTVNGVSVKIMIDFAKQDTRNKIIYPKDVKTSVSHRQFVENYVKLNYGNQGSFYSGVLQSIFPGYKIAPFEFVVGCTDSKEPPMIYRMDPTEIEIYKNGVALKSGCTVPGWMPTLELIKWHMQTGNWSYPKEVYEKGYVTLKSVTSEAVEGTYADVEDIL